MTDDDKALVDGLRLLANTARKMSWVGYSPMLAPKVLNKSADRIEALSAENERLREALREVFEEWAGSEGFIPETAPEGYLLQLTKRMADIARAALGDTE